jgi:lipopolysaccharide transport protein LptA
MVNSVLRLTGLLLACCAAAAQQVTEPLPISLDADSSSFDRRSNTVSFEGLRITQGALGIEADNARATGLDFGNSQWRFSGNVRITIDSAKILSNSADLQFLDHQLLSAALRGEPAQFEDVARETGEPIVGYAKLFEYDTAQGTIRMTEQAFLSEGPNEISGCDLLYDLGRETITASSSECGEPVRMTIQPPRNIDDGELPTADPAAGEE